MLNYIVDKRALRRKIAPYNKLMFYQNIINIRFKQFEK